MFQCHWDTCSSNFTIESELHLHLKSHALGSKKGSCRWKSCTSTTLYKHRGHLSDHMINHLSSDFVSIWCAGCRAAFRTRQALSRHQKVSKCNGSYRDGDLFLPVLANNEEILRILGRSRSLSIGLIVKKRKLDAIISEATQGLHLL
jgi:hypothetical protein